MKTTQPTQYRVAFDFSVLRPDLDRSKLEKMVKEFGEELSKITESYGCTHEIRQLAPNRFTAKLCEFIASLDPADWDPCALDLLKGFTEGWDENESDKDIQDRLFDAMSRRIVDSESDDPDSQDDFGSDLDQLRDLLREHIGVED